MTPTLPNDIIMRIIREADGGLNTHKKKMSQSHDMLLMFPKKFSHGDHLRTAPSPLTDCDERANDENMWFISTLSGGHLYVPIADEDYEREDETLDETMYEKNKSIASQMVFPENADASWMYSLVLK